MKKNLIEKEARAEEGDRGLPGRGKGSVRVNISFL
jgi:hypothetical protein